MRALSALFLAAVFLPCKACLAMGHGNAEEVHLQEMMASLPKEVSIIFDYLADEQDDSGFTADREVTLLSLAEAEYAGAQIGKQKGVSRQPLLGDGTLQIRLEDVVRIALEKNLNIQIFALDSDALKPRVEVEKAFFDPIVGMIVNRGSSETVTGSGFDARSAEVFISQELPTGGNVLLSMLHDNIDPIDKDEEFTSTVAISLVQPLMRGGRIYVATRFIEDAEYDVRIAEAQLKAEMLRVSAQAKAAYYNTLLAQQVIEVTEAAIKRDRLLLEASQALLDANLVTIRDVLSAEVSLAKDKDKLVQARSDLESTKNDLLEVLGLPIGREVTLLDRDIAFESIPLEIEKWIATALENRPEILQFKEQLDKSALNIRVRENEVLPQLDLIASYAREQTDSTFNRSFRLGGKGWNVGLAFSIPIGNVAAKELLSQARIERESIRTQLLQQERSIELEVRDSVIKLRNSLGRIEALTAVRDQAQRLLKVAIARFSMGLATNLDVTAAQEDLLDAETELAGAIVDYNTGLAELEAAIGAPI